MKKIKIILSFCLVFFSLLYGNINATNLNLQSKYVGVYKADDMKLLYGKNEEEVISIASMTKIMTAIVSIENISDLNEKVTIDYSLIADKISTDLAVCGIKDGQILTYYDLIATTLIPSGADSALYLANIIFGDYDTFISKMNDKAKDIGMTNTSFDNPVGLDSENNYSTISDVAKLLKYALENDTLKEMMSTSSYITSDGTLTVGHTINKSASRSGVALNNILGGKTGTTGDAGICLASFSDDDGIKLISVVAGASMYSSRPHNIIDSENLFEYIKNSYNERDIISQGEDIIEVKSAACNNEIIKFYADKSIVRYEAPVDKSKLSYEYIKNENPTNAIVKDTKVGEVKVYYNGEYLETVDLKLSENIDFKIIDWAKNNLLGIS